MSIRGARPEFSQLAIGWRSDGFDALMARINMVGDWVQQNGGRDAMQWGEIATVTHMMARAVRFGMAGAVPRKRKADA